MSRRTQENLIAAALLCVFIGVIVMSLGYGPRARMIPLPLATFGIILVVVQIIWQNLRSTTELQVDLLQVLTRQAEEAGAAPGEGEGGSKRNSSWRKEAVALGIVAVLVGLILLVGPIPAVFAFTGGYFLLSRHYSWLKGIIYTVAFTVAVYLLFVVALEVQLYHGVLEPLVERFR
ncbi:MAG: tripartite tricarboxylate transporter TctB family protein [Betaproteobacteria bacterium]|nr:tripartite tricarboxylate transporter TctB family protein [Betaproteobacteria bacterium]